MAVLAHFEKCAQTKKPSPILLFHLWEIKWIQSLDIITESENCAQFRLATCINFSEKRNEKNCVQFRSIKFID